MLEVIICHYNFFCMFNLKAVETGYVKWSLWGLLDITVGIRFRTSALGRCVGSIIFILIFACFFTWRQLRRCSFKVLWVVFCGCWILLCELRYKRKSEVDLWGDYFTFEFFLAVLIKGSWGVVCWIYKGSFFGVIEYYCENEDMKLVPWVDV